MMAYFVYQHFISQQLNHHELLVQANESNMISTDDDLIASAVKMLVPLEEIITFAIAHAENIRN